MVKTAPPKRVCCLHRAGLSRLLDQGRNLSGLLLVAWIALSGCAHRSVPPSAVDYADRANWVLIPSASEVLAEWDLFYVYPTVVADRENPLMSWADEAIRQKTTRIARQQTGMVSGEANVYAPYCRQLEFFRIWGALGQPPVDTESFRVGIEDVRAAFRHYMEYWNDGRPFVLLGHSQGAMDLFGLIQQDFGDPAVWDRLVAAYLIGMAIRPEELAESSCVRLASGEEDTGVIVSYNSVAPGTGPTPFTGPGVYGINPLNWRTDGESASRTQHLGAVFFDDEGQAQPDRPHFCDARMDVDAGALVVELDDPGAYDAPALLGPGVYHMNDIYFFYRNLFQNMQVRLAAWKAAR